jgi:DNA-binding transcriptional LysR family regulator
VELRHLRHFTVIAEAGSFSRAAERLWLGQPALSSQIRRLETELGLQLFERRPRGVELTEAGELFLERARTALVALDAAQATGADFAAGLVGSVRVGITSEVRSSLLASLLHDFGQTRPDIEVTTIEAHSGTLLRSLADRRLDVVVAPSSFGPADLRRTQLGREPWVVLIGAGHRLAAPGPIVAAELDGEQVIVTGHRDGAAYDRVVVETLTGAGATPVLVRAGPGPALYRPVCDGQAVALATDASATHAGLVARPLDPPRRVPFALLAGDEEPVPALAGLIRAAKATAARTPGANRRLSLAS